MEKNVFEMYCVKDTVADNFLEPLFVNNEAQAKRWFASNLKNIPLWNENAEQFELYRIGQWDGNQGEIRGKGIKPGTAQPQFICKGSDLIG